MINGIDKRIRLIAGFTELFIYTSISNNRTIRVTELAIDDHAVIPIILLLKSVGWRICPFGHLMPIIIPRGPKLDISGKDSNGVK